MEPLTKQQKRSLLADIEADIESGIYNTFPVVKNQLEHIATKLTESIYVVNSSKHLTRGELETLSDNGYLPELFYF